MKTRIELDPQVADFVRALAPEPRRKLRQALRDLELEKGDFLALEGELTGYCRLRVGVHRVIVRFHVERSHRVARCVFVEQRSVVYALMAELIKGEVG